MRDLPAVSGSDDVAPAAGRPDIPGFRLIERIGEGGMGVVWRAEQLATRRETALKVMPAGAVGSARARQRFEREVALAALLDHPRIARVFESGDWAGGLYYAMQLVPGVPLDVYVQRRALPPRAIVELIRHVAEAVQHAHQRGVIHRDLKPSNILVTDAGEPVVVDFGLAKAIGGEGWSPDVTVSGELAGTVAYMSPEQAAAGPTIIDTRSDVYSLGVILYRLLTGRHPHDLSGSQLDVLQRIRDRDVPRPSRKGDRIDRDLEAVLLKALERDADRRYGTAGELAADLARYLATEPVQARRQTLAYVVGRRIVKHRTPLGIAGAAALLALAVTGVLYARDARVPIYTDPPGAEIFINGKPHWCPTNCSVFLGPGRHDILLRFPTEGHPTNARYQELRRSVHVAWGRYSYDGTPTATLTPAFQFIRFVADGGPATIAILDAGGTLIDQSPAPLLRRLDVGNYTIRATFDDGQRAERAIYVIGGSEPRLVRLAPDAETTGPAERPAEP